MTDEPAFPNTGNNTWNLQPATGMSLRDYFSGQALAGIVANPAFFGPLFQQEPRAAADFALAAADAMLAPVEAVAPDLLAACEALLERYRIMVAADGPECLQAIAAIAKARGEA